MTPQELTALGLVIGTAAFMCAIVLIVQDVRDWMGYDGDDDDSLT